jgi:Flp pilus assembly protein TadG
VNTKRPSTSALSATSASSATSSARLGAASQRGSATAVVVISSMAMLLLFGVLVDSGRIFAAEQSMEQDAAAAARTGSQPNTDDLASNTITFRSGIDAINPTEGAITFLQFAGYDRSQVSVTFNEATGTMRVVIRKDIPMTVLQMIGMTSKTVTATAETRTQFVPQGN